MEKLDVPWLRFGLYLNDLLLVANAAIAGAAASGAQLGWHESFGDEEGFEWFAHGQCTVECLRAQAACARRGGSCLDITTPSWWLSFMKSWPLQKLQDWLGM